MVLSIKNLDRICFSLVVLLFLAGGYLTGSFWIKKQKAAIQEAEQIARRSEELNRIEKDRLRLQKALDIQSKNMNAIHERIPESADIGAFLKELNALIRKNEIALTSIRPMPPLKEEHHTRTPIHLLCKGPFERIYDLLLDLESMKRILWMEKMMISRREASQDCELELTMNILEYDNKTWIGKGA